MGKKPKSESDQEQYKRFLEKVQELVDAGELSPTEAEEKFDRAIKRVLEGGQSKPPSA